MINTTLAILFKTIPHGESSIIARMLTEKFGMQSYIIKGVRKGKKKIVSNILQPLSLLEIVCSNKPGNNMGYISELIGKPAYKDIPFNVQKSSLLLFMNELLYKTLNYGNDNGIFHFIYNSLIKLDEINTGLKYYSLFFILNLSRFSGFYPSIQTYRRPCFFDLKNGVFSDIKPIHEYYLEPEYAEILYMLMICNEDDYSSLNINPNKRLYLLKELIKYYGIHTGNSGKFKSIEILEQTLS